MQLLCREFEEATILSIGHRSELEAFHSRKIILKRVRGGAKLVSDTDLGQFDAASRCIGEAMAAVETTKER